MKHEIRKRISTDRIKTGRLFIAYILFNIALENIIRKINMRQLEGVNLLGHILDIRRLPGTDNRVAK